MEILNRKARHDYFIEDTYEAGIELTGTEIKSIREGNANIKDSYGITLKRVIYDVEETINDAIEADVPDLNIYIRETREAVYLRRKK